MLRMLEAQNLSSLFTSAASIACTVCQELLSFVPISSAKNIPTQNIAVKYLCTVSIHHVDDSAQHANHQYIVEGSFHELSTNGTSTTAAGC